MMRMQTTKRVYQILQDLNRKIDRDHPAEEYDEKAFTIFVQTGLRLSIQPHAPSVNIIYEKSPLSLLTVHHEVRNDKRKSRHSSSALVPPELKLSRSSTNQSQSSGSSRRSKTMRQSKKIGFLKPPVLKTSKLTHQHEISDRKTRRYMSSAAVPSPSIVDSLGGQQDKISQRINNRSNNRRNTYKRPSNLISVKFMRSSSTH